MHILSFFLLFLMFTNTKSLSASDCGDDFRAPAYTDISVACGTMSIDLAIIICPAIYSGFNQSLLIVNGMANDPACMGKLDDSVSPYVLRFNFPINQTNSCNSVFMTTSAPGTGVFGEFSNIQMVKISGVVRSLDTSTGTVTYNTELKYFYSCAYPLEYLMENTQISVLGTAISVQDSSGILISTLIVELFIDPNYTTPIVVPRKGLQLKTRIYTQIKAINLTSTYHVLLHRCYATVSLLSQNSTTFNLFDRCSFSPNTIIHQNGVSHKARFSFLAFRFLEKQHEVTSTYFIQCLTHLCHKKNCSALLQCSNRRRRSDDSDSEDGATALRTISSPAISIRADAIVPSEEELFLSNNNFNFLWRKTLLAVAAGVIVFTSFIFIIAAVFCRMFQTQTSNKYT